MPFAMCGRAVADGDYQLRPLSCRAVKNENSKKSNLGSQKNGAANAAQPRFSTMSYILFMSMPA